jgi:hypothetical protein
MTDNTPMDPFDDPAARAWAQRVVDELIPVIRNSAAAISIIPENAGIGDVKLAVELGLSMLLDKPIILAVVPGRRIPYRLARIADEIVEIDVQDQVSTARRVREAVGRVLGS